MSPGQDDGGEYGERQSHHRQACGERRHRLGSGVASIRHHPRKARSAEPVPSGMTALPACVNTGRIVNRGTRYGAERRSSASRSTFSSGSVPNPATQTIIAAFTAAAATPANT